MINDPITDCLRWLHAVYMTEAWDLSSLSKDEIRKPTEKNKGCLDCDKTLEHYGIKSQPSNTELDQIDHLSWSARGPAGEGHMLFHKVRRLPAMQYSTEHILQPSLHAEGHVSLLEPRSSQLSSVHPSETFAQRWDAEIIRPTGEFLPKNADDLTYWQWHFLSSHRMIYVLT